jgi:hypothetical protein
MVCTAVFGADYAMVACMPVVNGAKDTEHSIMLAATCTQKQVSSLLNIQDQNVRISVECRREKWTLLRRARFEST